MQLQPSASEGKAAVIIRWVAPSVMLLLLLAEVFADPRKPHLLFYASIFHLLAIGGASATVLMNARALRKPVVLICCGVIFWALGELLSSRFLYLMILGIIFSAAGYCAVNNSRGEIERLVLWLLGAATLVGLLQVLGVHDLLYAWARHGYLGNGEAAPLTRVNTFLMQTYQLDDLTLYQARPSSIFSSNQLFTGFLLFVVGLVITSSGTFFSIGVIFLTVAASLSMSKAALFGIMFVAIAVAAFIPKYRVRGVITLCALFLSYAAYAWLFPGLVEFVLTPRIIADSLIVRLEDFVTAMDDGLGLDGRLSEMIAPLLAAMASSGNIVVAQIGSKWTNRADFLVDDGGSLSLLVEAVIHPWHALFIIVSVALIAIFNGSLKPRERLHEGWIIVCGLLLYGLIANTSNSMIYWYWVGFACHAIYGKELIGTDCILNRSGRFQRQVY